MPGIGLSKTYREDTAMSIKFTDLQCREVICISTGQRLGFVSDIQIEIPEGNVCALVVPCPGKFFSLTGRHEDYIIPWNAIKKIGPDIVLVDVRPESCRSPRPGKGLLF